MNNIFLIFLDFLCSFLSILKNFTRSKTEMSRYLVLPCLSCSVIRYQDLKVAIFQNYHWLLRRLGKTHSKIYMIKKRWIEKTFGPVIYVVVIKSTFRTLWEIGSLFASFLPGASFSIFLVHFLKPLLLRSLFKNRTEPHGVSLIKFQIEKISVLSNFRLNIFQQQAWIFQASKIQFMTTNF